MSYKKFIVTLFAFLATVGLPVAAFCEHHHHHNFDQRYASDSYPHIVNVIEHEIYLSNGYMWKMDRAHFDRSSDESVHHLWKVGDRVYFTINSKDEEGHPKGVLFNYDLETMMIGAKPSRYSMVGCIHWEHVNHDRQRISYIESQGHTIILCGGSRWNVGMWSGLTSRHWKEGDLVQISPQYHSHMGEATHTLINISHNLETVNATMIRE
jgi:hypothetical protein